MIRFIPKNLPCHLAVAFVGASSTSAQSADSAIWSIETNVNKSVLIESGFNLPIVPNGQITDSGWALARLNDGGSAISANSYLFPETKAPVRLYLIDTAVDNSSGWFDSNPNLSITPELVR